MRIVLHEIAHALSGARLGDLIANVTLSQREVQKMVDEFNRLGREVAPDEVPRVKRLQDEIQSFQADLTHWQAKLQGADQSARPRCARSSRCPTPARASRPTGRTSPVEAFAEAFSLCRTDPDAGRRIARQVCAFFDSDAYLQAGS